MYTIQKTEDGYDVFDPEGEYVDTFESKVEADKAVRNFINRDEVMNNNDIQS